MNIKYKLFLQVNQIAYVPAPVMPTKTRLESSRLCAVSPSETSSSPVIRLPPTVQQSTAQAKEWFTLPPKPLARS